MLSNYKFVNSGRQHDKFVKLLMLAVGMKRIIYQI